jgi:hypothetical protein
MARTFLYPGSLLPLGPPPKLLPFVPPTETVVIVDQPVLYEEVSAPVNEIPGPPNGWRKDGLDLEFATPFPVTAQQYAAFQPKGTIVSTYPQGWRKDGLDFAFVQPFPVQDQLYTPFREPEPITLPTWYAGWQFDYGFVKPFPVTEQIFSVWDLVGQVPIIFPPGAGKRYKPPTNYLPEPPYDGVPNKPFRPVWDRGGKIEAPKVQEPPKPTGPPPLPPMSIFGARPAPMKVIDGRGLPTFNEYVPHNAAATAQRMKQAMDESDAVAALKALGLIKE